jgi:hypothetical protein
VLLDWMLPGVPGLTFAWRLRSDQRTKDISIVLLSARAEEQNKVTALESGADDYVTKPFSARELLARIKAVMRRRAPQLADDVVEIAGLRIDPAAHVVTANDKPIDLWTTELRLLHIFMTHPGRVFSRARLLDEVWGEHVFMEEPLRLAARLGHDRDDRLAHVIHPLFGEQRMPRRRHGRAVGAFEGRRKRDVPDAVRTKLGHRPGRHHGARRPAPERDRCSQSSRGRRGNARGPTTPAAGTRDRR